ncbi:hypothetical protein GCM10027614_20250 [Micromonospora vulcania]
MDRVGGGQDVEREPGGTVPGDQAAEPVPAGHHDEAARTARDEGSDLVGVGNVVQYEQDPPAGERRTVQRDLRVRLGRYPVGCYAQRVQQER